MIAAIGRIILTLEIRLCYVYQLAVKIVILVERSV